jgi:RNA polymerase sigma-70 factor, ECF subfamily
MVLVYQIADYVGDGVKKLAKNLQAGFIISDAQLLERAKNRDDGAFNELVKRHQQFVYKVAFGYLNDSEAARDVVQDVFLKAYRGLPYFQSDSQFTTWLYKICKNHCLNVIRRHKLETDNPPEINSGEIPDISLKSKLKKLISRLSEDHREIIILRYYNDLKYDEIARYLGINPGTVKIRLHRAKRELKQLAGVDIQ